MNPFQLFNFTSTCRDTLTRLYMMHSQNITDASRNQATVTMGCVNQHGHPPDVTASLVTMVTDAVSIDVILRETF